MNIIIREWKQGWKSFLIWALGLGVLVIGGMVKFTAMAGSDSAEMTQLLAQFPRPVLAIFGMAEANIETLSGFYSVLQFYAVLALSCYAVSLGCNAVLRESIDKTDEFLFTKPCGRTYVLTAKLIASWAFLTVLCMLNGLFSYLAPVVYGLENTIPWEMLRMTAAAYAVALLFFALSAALAAWIPRAERAVQAAYGLLLTAYAFSVVFDMDTRFAFLRPVTPFRYFRARELLNGQINSVYLAVTVGFIAVCLGLTVWGFRKKDLTET